MTYYDQHQKNCFDEYSTITRSQSIYLPVITNVFFQTASCLDERYRLLVKLFNHKVELRLLHLHFRARSSSRKADLFKERAEFASKHQAMAGYTFFAYLLLAASLMDRVQQRYDAAFSIPGILASPKISPDQFLRVFKSPKIWSVLVSKGKVRIKFNPAVGSLFASAFNGKSKVKVQSPRDGG